jgi:hypothetical protein
VVQEVEGASGGEEVQEHEVEIYEGTGGVPPILVQVVEEGKVDRPSDGEEVQEHELKEEEGMGGVPLIVV